MRDYPTGKVQQMVLDALNLTASGHGDANRIFDDLGLVVASKREGRRSIPRSSWMNAISSAFW